MTPKEKADELISKFLDPICYMPAAKKHAIIVVDEILNLKMIGAMGREDRYNEYEFWLEVRKELENL